MWVVESANGNAAVSSSLVSGATTVSARVERLAAAPVAAGTTSDRVPLFGVLFVDSRTRRLVKVNSVTGSVTPVSVTALTFRPQCECCCCDAVDVDAVVVVSGWVDGLAETLPCVGERWEGLRIDGLMD